MKTQQEDLLMRLLSSAADLAGWNLLTLLLCLPVVTSGGAMRALCAVLRAGANGDPAEANLAAYFRVFRTQWKTGLKLQLIGTGIFALGLYDLYLLSFLPGRMPDVIGILLLAALIAVFALYRFVYFRQESRLKEIFVGAFLQMTARPLRTVCLCVVHLIYPALWVAFLYNGGTGFLAGLTGLFLLTGLSVPNVISARLLKDRN